MKISKLFAIAAATTLALTACSSDADDADTADSTATGTSDSASESDDDASDGADTDGEIVNIVVGASPVPHADILQFVADNLAEEAGISIEIREFTDYIQPNVALDAGDLDANFFQHVPYFEGEVESKGYNFEHGEGVHIEPYGVYSESVEDISDLPDGGIVVVTNDPSNQARALQLLESEGLITLADVDSPTIYDIEDNPKNLDIREAEAPAIPIQLPDVAAAIINGNFALEAGLVPAEDAILVESGEDNPYANILAWNVDGEKLDAVKTLEELLHSQEVADFITETYPNGELIPAFSN